MTVINLSEQPSLLSQYLKEIRSKHIQRDPLRFRRNIERIGQLMAYEVSKALQYRPENIETPLAMTQVATIQDPIVLGTVLRAGLPMHQGFLSMYDLAENAFLSAYRKMGMNGLEIVSEYLAAPNLTGKTLILVDPMLATMRVNKENMRAAAAKNAVAFFRCGIYNRRKECSEREEYPHDH